jgi:hypothetical protein
MKKNRGDELIVVVVQIYMEMSQGNSLCSYLYLKQAKMSFFFLFTSTKSEKKRAEQVGDGVIPVGGGRVNMV